MNKQPMNRFYSDLSAQACSCLQEFEKPPSLPAQVSISQPIWLGYSIHPLNLHPGIYSDWQKNPNMPRYSYPLYTSLISYLPSTESKLLSLRPLNKDSQQQDHTETFKFIATKPFRYTKPVPLTLADLHVSGVDEVGKSKCTTTSKRKEIRVTVQERKAKRAKSKARYEASDRGKETRAKYAESDIAQDLKAKYNKSDKGRVKQAIRSARSYAYRLAKNSGLSERLARKSGERAANEKRAFYLQHPPFGLSVTKVKECLQSRSSSSHPE